ncbi:MAG: 16S rRNA (cytidine(1402)-2'-O)-methyltransferase, partial [Pseudomonadota bacterium]
MAGGSKSGERAQGGRGALGPGLHFLATPIGAADDITVRGLAALREADVLAAEDTRTLRKLMELHGVPLGGRPLIAYHEHNSARALPGILARLEAGERVVYASDAGTPLVADPGFRLAREARERGVAVRALPGPSALLAGLLVSGLPTDRFSFGGFPPPKTSARRRAIAAWRGAPGSLVFFETGRRLAESLEDMAAELGDRPAAVARELTKAFEETRTGRLSALAAQYRESGPPKGEIVVVIGPGEAIAPTPSEIDDALKAALMTEGVRDASRTVANMLGTGRKLVYQRAVELSDSLEGRGAYDDGQRTGGQRTGGQRTVGKQGDGRLGDPRSGDGDDAIDPDDPIDPD